MARSAEELAAGGPTWFISIGTSMVPAVKAVQRVSLRPVRAAEPLDGHIVLSKVDDRFWLHRVTQERAGEVHIAADNGLANGWAPRSQVFGVLA